MPQSRSRKQATYTEKTTAEGVPYLHVELRGDPHEPTPVSRGQLTEGSSEMSAAMRKGQMSVEINKEMDDETSGLPSSVLNRIAIDRARDTSSVGVPVSAEEMPPEYLKMFEDSKAEAQRQKAMRSMGMDPSKVKFKKTEP